MCGQKMKDEWNKLVDNGLYTNDASRRIERRNDEAGQENKLFRKYFLFDLMFLCICIARKLRMEYNSVDANRLAPSNGMLKEKLIKQLRRCVKGKEYWMST